MQRPAWSTDLNPLDHFLLIHLKTITLNIRIEYLKHLKFAVRAICLVSVIHFLSLNRHLRGDRRRAGTTVQSHGPQNPYFTARTA